MLQPHTQLAEAEVHGAATVCSVLRIARLGPFNI